MNERRPARSTLAGVHGRCFLLVLLAAWGAAAIGPARGRAAERTWVRVTSPSFTVVPDAGDRRAARVAWQFEQVRAVLQRLWPWRES